MCSPEHVKEFRLDNLEAEINLLEKALSEHDQKIGFCHNDLQYGNIMIDNKAKSITLIVSSASVLYTKNFGRNDEKLFRCGII